MTSFCNFLEFEDLLRSFSASELAVQRRDYAAKASISGRIACERLIEQEKTNKNFFERKDKQEIDRGSQETESRLQVISSGELQSGEKGV
jgi:hypothetical protein